MRKKVMAWLLVLTLTIANSNLVYAVDTAPQTNEKIVHQTKNRKTNQEQMKMERKIRQANRMKKQIKMKKTKNNGVK